jgi:hypothetical protein
MPQRRVLALRCGGAFVQKVVQDGELFGRLCKSGLLALAVVGDQALA